MFVAEQETWVAGCGDERGTRGFSVGDGVGDQSAGYGVQCPWGDFFGSECVQRR